MKHYKIITAFLLSLVICLCGCESNDDNDVMSVSSTETSMQTSEQTSTAVTTVTTSAEATTAPDDFKNEVTQKASPSNEKEVLNELKKQQTTSKPKAKSTTTQKPQTQAKVSSPSPSVVRTPVAKGTKVYQGNGAVIDASNCSDGYIMAKCSGTSKRLKLQIKTSNMTYNYDLNNSGSYEVFPLQMGNGTYNVRVMENVTDTSYRQLFSAEFSVSLESSLLPFLYPNQYIKFKESSACVRKASVICSGCTTDIEKLKAIYNFMTTNIKYDYAKAKTVQTGYLPDVDEILNTGKGICFDYASLMAAMLRSQNIPTQLVIGSAGALAQNHAWNEVYLKGTGWITLKIQNTSTGWKLLDPTFGDKTGSTSQYAAARVY